MSIPAQSKLLKILEITGGEYALRTFEETINYYAEHCGLKNAYWIQGPNPITSKPPSIAEVKDECIKVARLKSEFRFHWLLQSKKLEENWNISIHFTRFSRIEYAYDIGNQFPMEVAKELLNKRMIDVIDCEAGEMAGNAFALYIFQKMNSAGILRRWRESEMLRKETLFKELKDALVRSRSPVPADEVILLRKNKKQIREMISKWDQILVECVGTKKLQEILNRFELPLGSWLHP